MYRTQIADCYDLLATRRQVRSIPVLYKNG